MRELSMDEMDLVSGGMTVTGTRFSQIAPWSWSIGDNPTWDQDNSNGWLPPETEEPMITVTAPRIDPIAADFASFISGIVVDIFSGVGGANGGVKGGVAGGAVGRAVGGFVYDVAYDLAVLENRIYQQYYQSGGTQSVIYMP